MAVRPSRRARVGAERERGPIRVNVGGALFTAFALVLVLEGIAPLLFPALWKEAFRRFIGLANGQLRFLGLMSVVAGIALLFAMHGF